MTDHFRFSDRPVQVEKVRETSQLCGIVTNEEKIRVYSEAVEISHYQKICGFREKFQTERFVRSDISTVNIGGNRDPKLAIVGIIFSILAIGAGIIIGGDWSYYIYVVAGSIFLSCLVYLVSVCMEGETATIMIKIRSGSFYRLTLSKFDVPVIADVLIPLEAIV